MATSRIIASALGAAAAVGVLAAGAVAQHYVPLRYDLRYTPNPGYIQAVPYALAPSRPDPYAFGSIRYGDLDITGNVRAGKSFRGNVPFTQQGSQVSARLPSLALSNFRRDSVGIEDIGTGVEHGAALPYFPGSGSVTSITTAQMRFAPPPSQDRAPYALPNLDSALPGYIPMPGATLAGSTPPPALSPQQAATYRPGLYIPQSAIDWVNALVEGRSGGVAGRAAPAPGEPAPGDLTSEQRRTDLRLGLPVPQADPRIGLPKEPPERAVQAAPGGETPAPMMAQETDAAAGAAASDAPASAIYWRLREAARADKAPASVGAPAPADAPTGGTGRVRRPGAAEPDEVESAMLGPGDLPADVPPAPDRLPAAPATFQDYLRRAETAMNAGRHGAADALYEAATVMDPNQPAAFFGRVAALLGDYRYLQAAMVLDKGLKAHPEWARQVPDLRSAFPKASTYERIVADLAEDVQNRPQSAQPNLLLGYVYVASGKPDDARPYLKHAAALRGEQAGAEKALLEAIAPPAPGK